MADNYQLKAILSAVDNMSPALKAISQTARSTRKYLTDVGSASGRMASSIGMPLTALSGIIGSFSLMGMKNVMTHYTQMANAIKDGAVMAGMSTADFQRWKYVADQSDISAESLTGAMGKLNKNIGAAASGKNAELSSLFNHLGISMRDSSGHMRNAADLLPQISEAFLKNKKPVTQARMGMEIFGKSWQELMPLLSEGKDSLEATGERFKQLKGGLKDVDLDAADALNKKFKDLEFVTKGFGNAIAKELVPTIAPLTEEFIQWAAANKKIISANVRAVVNDLVNGLRSFDWKGFVESIKSMARGFGVAVDMVGGAKNALIAFAIVMNANAIMATASMIGALSRLVLWLGSTAIGLDVVKGKMILTGGVIATANTMVGASFSWLRMQALAALLVLRMGGVSGLVSVVMSSIASAVATAGAALMGAGRAVMLFSRALLLSPLGIVIAIATAALLIYENWGTLKKWFGEFFDWIGEKWKAFVGWIEDAAKTVGKFFGGDNESVMKVVTQSAQQQPANAPYAQQQPANAPYAQQQPANAPYAQQQPATAPYAQQQPTTAPYAQQQPRTNTNAPWAPVAAQQQKVGGAIEINFNNAPPGMRVEQKQSRGPLDLNLNAGYRSAALGMP